MCGDWIQWAKAGITCNLHGPWKKSRWWWKGISKPGVSPKSCWVNSEAKYSALYKVRPQRLEQEQWQMAASDSRTEETRGCPGFCMLQCALLVREWNIRAVTSLPLPRSPWEVKKLSFQEMTGLCPSQGMHEDPFLLKRRKTSAPTSCHLQLILQILTQSTSLHWFKNNNKNTAVKVQTAETIIPRSL